MKMNLEYGQGWISALLDIQRNAIVAYDSGTAKEVHEQYGGKQYCTSRSGSSGAGYIDAGLHIRPINVYRVDISYPECGGHVETLPGVKIYSPFRYDAEYHNEYPVVTVLNNDKYIFDDGPAIDKWTNYDEDFTLTYCIPLYCNYSTNVDVTEAQRGGILTHEKRLFISNIGNYSPRIIRRVMEGLHHDDLTSDVPPANVWWSSLGLYPVGNAVWKITNRIIRSSTSVEELTVEKLQELSPANVKFYSPDFYVQERTKKNCTSFVAAARCTIDNEEYEYEIDLNTSQIFEVLRGHYEDVRTQCLTGCQQKAARDAKYKKDRRHEEQFNNRFGELVSVHGDRVISIQDSVDAGNCEHGTKAWRDQHYPGKDEVHLRALAQHKADANVWRVLRYVLRDIKLNVPEEVLPHPEEEVIEVATEEIEAGEVLSRIRSSMKERAEAARSQ
jgi:hypothetical protein